MKKATLSYSKGTCNEEVLNGVQESPADPEFDEPKKHQTKTAQENQVGQTANSSRWEKVEVSFLMIEAHEEDKEKHHKDHTDKSCEESWRIDSLSWCFSHNNGWNSIEKLMSWWLVQRISKVDLAASDLSSDLFF